MLGRLKLTATFLAFIATPLWLPPYLAWLLTREFFLDMNDLFRDFHRFLWERD